LVVPFWRSSTIAYEAIHLGKLLAPVFLCYDKQKFWTENQILLEETESSRKILKPVEDIPYEPYNFAEEEIRQLNVIAMPNASEERYQTIFNTISPYQDTEIWHRQIDSAGILLSYSQDKVESVP
jgi:hypothetical protein